MKARSLRPSPAMIVALFALIVSMSAGAYAVVVAPKNSVVSKSIKNGQVKTKDLKANAVKAGQIADGSVGAADIADGSVGTGDIADGSVGSGDLSAAVKTDLNDASTLGGLSVAQIVAASGGEYFQAKQAAAPIDIEVIDDNAANLVSINLPKAGKYLISARVPVTCTYDGTDGATPANPAPNQPYFFARARLMQGATQLASDVASCEAEAGQAFFLVPVYSGTTYVELTHQITTTGATTLTLQGMSAPNLPFIVETTAGARIEAEANDSIIQAITVQ